ncbi:MAG: patatin-like phospholipase family protein [Alcanivorax sp.]|nr:patatin-like phospholipase family protein [Alcanivorax sp.]
MRIWLAAGLVLCLSGSVLAAEPLRTGLILSGGGARGLAHIGVLRALRERGIHIDAVAGTSMGAIVGGLYASGYPQAEIESIARNMDWKYAFSDQSPRSHSLYEYRQLDAGAPVDYRLRISRHGITLPRAALQGQHLTLVLDEIFAPVRSVDDFDQLPIPFRAVAADLVTGKRVIIDHGRLSSAVRASMSIPGLLEPVEQDNRLLVDGGIADNIPIDALADKHLDRLIVVDVGSPRWEKENIHSVAQVLGQLTALMVRNNSDQQIARMGPRDILITPQLDGISSSDFNRVDDAITSGYRAAIKVLGPPAKEIAKKDNLPNGSPQIDLRPVINFVDVENQGPVSDQVIKSMVHQQPGKPFDRVQLRDDISHIYALDYFDSIRYRLVEHNGKTGLRISASERKTSNTYTQLGVQFSDDLRGNGTFGLYGSLRSAGLNRFGGTAVVFANLGSSPLLEARFFQPVGQRLIYFIEPVAGYRADTIDLYFNNNIGGPAAVSYRRSEIYGGLDIGAGLFRQRAELRLGARASRDDFSPKTGVGFDGGRYQDRYFFSRFGWDTYNDLAFPSHGVRASFEQQWHEPGFGADQKYQRSLMDLGVAHKLKGVSVVAEVSAAVSDQSPGPEAISPLGGFLSLSGLPPSSIWGYQRALGRLVFTVPLRHNLILPSSLQVYAGASYEQGNVWQDREEIAFNNTLSGGSLFLGTRTPLGPGYISLGFTEGNHRSINFYFGHVFR